MIVAKYKILDEGLLKNGPAVIIFMDTIIKAEYPVYLNSPDRHTKYKDIKIIPLRHFHSLYKEWIESGSQIEYLKTHKQSMAHERWEVYIKHNLEWLNRQHLEREKKMKQSRRCKKFTRRNDKGVY